MPHIWRPCVNAYCWRKELNGVIGQKTIELDEQLLYSSSRWGRSGYRSRQNHNNRRSQCHGTNRCLEDGMIPPEQVVPLEATREVEENKMVEESIIAMRENVGTARSKEMCKQNVQPNKHMSGTRTTSIQTMLRAPSNAMIRRVA